MKPLLRAFLKPFDWSGTVSRRGYWQVMLVLVALVVVLVVWPGVLEVGTWQRPVALSLLQFPLLSVVVRRLHDIGRTGLWAILLVSPLAILLLIWLGFSRSSPIQGSRWHDHGQHRIGQSALVVLVLIAASRVFWNPYWIPSGSMKPTLLIGDYVLAIKQGVSAQRTRGDVLVFRHPVNDSTLVARLIGLPGDSVQIKDGVVLLNDDAVVVQDISDFEEILELQGPRGHFPRCANNVAVGQGGICKKSRQIETLPNGAAYEVLNIGNSTLDHTRQFTVPKGHYFLLGDNRDNATDSRLPQSVGGFGFVPVDNLIGKMSIVIFSSAGRSLMDVFSWRGDRVFKRVK